MSQNDFNIANQGFAAFRGDLNGALQALATNSSGATGPSTTYAYQWWYDTTANILKIRNAANSAWINFASFDQGAGTWSLNITGGSINGTTIGATTPSTIAGTTGSFSGDLTIADKIVHSGDTNTAIRFPADDTVTVETNGSERMRVGSSGNVGIGTTAPTARLHVGASDGYSGASSASNNLASFKADSVETGIRVLARSYNAATKANLDLANFESKNFDIRSGFRLSGGVGATAATANEYLAFSSIALQSGGTITETERMRINSAGNVGIGTVSPSQALDVNGTIKGNALIVGGQTLLMPANSALVTLSGSSVDFTGIPATARRVTLMMNGLSTNGTSIPLIRLGDAGGIETTGYLGSTGFVASGVTASASVFTDGIYLGSSWNAAATFHGPITMTLMDAPTNLWAVMGNIGRSDGLGQLFFLGYTKPLSETLTQLRLTTNSANVFDAGTASISWE